MLSQVDRHADAPPYKQIAGQLRALIADGAYAVGDKLPSESAMSHACGVSRQTVRQALAVLKDEGVVEARHGVGVFVAGAPAPEETAWGRFSRAVRELHLAAGSPSIREVTERTSVSRATVHSVLRLRKMPTIQAIQAVVQALGGDVNQFEQYWVDFHHESDGVAPGPERTELDELAAIRELLEERLPVHEVACPSCGTVVRARMADR